MEFVYGRIQMSNKEMSEEDYRYRDELEPNKRKAKFLKKEMAELQEVIDNISGANRDEIEYRGEMMEERLKLEEELRRLGPHPGTSWSTKGYYL